MNRNTTPRRLRLYKAVRISKDEKKKKRPRSILDSDVIVTNPKVVQIFEKDPHLSNKSPSNLQKYFSQQILLTKSTPVFLFPSLRKLLLRRTFECRGIIWLQLQVQELYFSPKKVVKTRILDIFANCHWKVTAFFSSASSNQRLTRANGDYRLHRLTCQLSTQNRLVRSPLLDYRSYEIFWMTRMDLRKIKLTAYYVPPSLPIPRKLENLQAEVRENGIRIVRSKTF